MEDANRLNKESLGLAKSAAASNDASTQESLRLTRQNLEATREALAFSRQSSEAAQREWIVLKGSEPQKLALRPVQDIIVGFALENLGNSPAVEVVTTVNSTATLAPFPVSPPYDIIPGRLKSVGIAGPRVPFVAWATLPGKLLDPGVIDQIASGQRKLYFYGMVEY